MFEKRIEHISYQLQQNKKNSQPGAIFFIGAGTSISAGIPTSDKIIDYTLSLYKDNPDIRCFEKKPSYAEIMECLSPRERNKIFRHYVENAKINVSQIYLAHLMYQGFVDYIITTNFDNLTQRALALYNIFPPTYDISILKDLTTTSLDTHSIIYLHGQYNGLWQLNTKEEMRKVIENDVAKTIFNQITDNRLWVVVGYSGDDFIFDQLVRMGRFDNGLYWVGFKDNEPSTRVQEALLNKTNTESFWIKGYDSDSFFLKLHSELKNEGPKIFSTPFSFLSELQEGINDIDDNEEYRSVKERLSKTKKMVFDAINRYERIEKVKPIMTGDEIEHTQLAQALIKCQITENYKDLSYLEKIVIKKGYSDLLAHVANIYFNWGTYYIYLAKTKSNSEIERTYLQAIEKYRKAIEVKPNFHESYSNWGNALCDLAVTKSGQEAENLFIQAFEKFKKAIEINPDNHVAYFSWGTQLGNLAGLKSGNEAESLFYQAFEKYKKAAELMPNDHRIFYNWGNELINLAELKQSPGAEKLYLQAFEKYSKAIEIKPDSYESYYNWGNNLRKLAKTKDKNEAEILFLQAFEKFSKATQIKPDFYNAYFNWGNELMQLINLKPESEAEPIYLSVFEKYKKATEIKPDAYEAYSNWAVSLGYLADTKSGLESEKLYLDAFEKYKMAVENKYDFFEGYFNWGNELIQLAKRKTGTEKDELYFQAFEKFKKTTEIKPDYKEAYYNWGMAIAALARTKPELEARSLFLEAIQKISISVELGAPSYNLASLYAVLKNIDNAFQILEICLKNKEITFEYVENDPDWNFLRSHEQYLNLKQIYLK